ncbi:MAG: uncharacterized protein H6Q90_5998 [Deltaproteobacteria bacterium]|nr:uncharacterized protein [Deltaproteobacteria bacterium]
MQPGVIQIEPFYDPATSTMTYVVYDPTSRDAVVIDPVLDYDSLTSRMTAAGLERVASFCVANRLRLHYVLETHAHADHVSGSQWLRRRFDARVAIGSRISEIQAVFKQVFDLPAGFPTDGSQFDRLLSDGDTIAAGTLQITVLATPGHTPACVSYLIEDAVFTGDALFVEDHGTGRCDFPRGDAAELYHSVHDLLYALPDRTRVFVGHDYQPDGRALRYETTIERSKRANVQLRATTTRDEFVQFRRERDASLAPPRLLVPSVQINIDAGHLPRPHANGRRYLTVPLTLGDGMEQEWKPPTSP